MPRDFTPVEQRPTRNLELRFDRLTSNSIVADAIEAFQIMHELARREAIRLRQTPANEGAALGPGIPFQVIETPSPQPAAGEITPDEAGNDEKGSPDGAAG